MREAKAIAREWVADHGSRAAGFDGAYFAGSVNWLSDHAELPVASDVDVWVVVASGNTPDKVGKIVYRDLLLDVAYTSREQLGAPDAILADYHLAGAFRSPSVITDPSGWLTELQAAVGRDYAKPWWVHRRCEHATAHALRYVRSLREAKLLHDQVIASLFAAGVTTHVLLVAGLKNPTVRRRYVAARELLAEYGRRDVHETLLEMLGCAEMTPARATDHLAAMTDAFDAAKTAIRTPFVFAKDISDSARPIAIDGSRELIDRGLHREAVFWIAVTYARCHTVLYHDAPAETQEMFSPGFRALLADLGIASFDDLRRRAAQVEAALPYILEVAESIIAATPEIRD